METIGKYRVIQELQSGDRPLYLARGDGDALVALKTVRTDGLPEERRERFLREAAVCRDLNHPNLVPVHDSGEASGVLYQAMEFLEGMDLGRAFADGRAFTWEEKISIMEQVAAGLSFAHGRGLVHRDIKPSNLFLETNGRVRILDFGMARIDSSNLTKSGAMVGTLNYMAPEQLRAETSTPLSDVFAAGIVFYQLACGRHPFSSGRATLPEVMSAILFHKPDPLDERAIGAPDGVSLVIGRALEKDPARRWRSADELRHAAGLCRFTLRMGPGSGRTVFAFAQQPAGQPESAAAPAPVEEGGGTNTWMAPVLIGSGLLAVLLLAYFVMMRG
ncbi:MAG: serine/threonine protein kinase [Bryobacterales bacterium]|nr:serine/threonine protein kinase [Bryobacterales bacterium]